MAIKMILCLGAVLVASVMGQSPNATTATTTASPLTTAALAGKVTGSLFFAGFTSQTAAQNFATPANGVIVANKMCSTLGLPSQYCSATLTVTSSRRLDGYRRLQGTYGVRCDYVVNVPAGGSVTPSSVASSITSQGTTGLTSLLTSALQAAGVNTGGITVASFTQPAVTNTSNNQASGASSKSILGALFAVLTCLAVSMSK